MNYIYQHCKHSDSAQMLAEALGWKLITKNDKIPINMLTDNILDWGYGIGKLKQYTSFSENGVPHIPFTTGVLQAKKWLEEGATVLARKLGNASNGKGIKVIKPGEELIEAKLYTKYLPKTREFRVDVVKGKAIAIREKRKKNGAEHNPHIWGVGKGWTFCWGNVTKPAGIDELAVKALDVVNKEIGAEAGFILNTAGVDIILCNGKLYVLEVNTAPGLTPIALEKYVNALKAS